MGSLKLIFFLKYLLSLSSTVSFTPTTTSTIQSRDREEVEAGEGYRIEGVELSDDDDQGGDIEV